MIDHNLNRTGRRSCGSWHRQSVSRGDAGRILPGRMLLSHDFLQKMRVLLSNWHRHLNWDHGGFVWWYISIRDW